jgi:hypothetical protein
VGSGGALPSGVRPGWRRDRTMGVVGRRALQLPRQLRPRCVPTRDGPSSSPTSPSSSSRARRDVGGSCLAEPRADAISTTVFSSGHRGKPSGGEDRDARSDVRRHDG